ncbi:MAG: FAD-dependent thymidylate synthase [Candidatus Undinarchaeales archaeon]|jgi:thymidylate synthase (FAD)|nr:FAD-dependent thymidylate synthase [Candidatus Undinarchaeales archaeon]
MTVKIINYNTDPDKLCGIAGFTSVSQEGYGELLEKISPEKAKTVLGNIIKLGHHSVIEHGIFTIAFENISAMFHQYLIEHRLASYTVRSKRYVNYSNVGHYVPSFFKYKPQLEKEFEEHVAFLSESYKKLVDAGIPTEDARFVLPFCTFDNIICTINARELAHFIYGCMYGHGRPYSEVRKAGEALLDQAKEIAPVIFDDINLFEHEESKKEEQLRGLFPDKSVPKLPEKKVDLLYCTENPDDKIATIATMNHLQVDADTAKELMHGKKTGVVNIICRNKRKREFEHANFTLRINKISLSVLTHLTRHRMQSLTIPKFTEVNMFYGNVLPKTISGKPELLEIYKATIDKTHELYKRFKGDGVPREVLSYLYQCGNLVSVVMTINARELHHFFRLRCCNRAQWEIQELADDILKEVKQKAPLIFEGAGSTCVIGNCPERNKTCGKMMDQRAKYQDMGK